MKEATLTTPIELGKLMTSQTQPNLLGRETGTTTLILQSIQQTREVNIHLNGSASDRFCHINSLKMKFKGRNKAIKKSSFSKPTHSQGKKHHISKGKNQKGNHSRVKAHNHEKHQQSRKSAFKGIFTDNKNMVTHSEERKKQN